MTAAKAIEKQTMAMMRALQSVQWLQFFVDLVAESPPFYLMHPATAQDGWHGGIHAVRGGTIQE